MMGTCKRTLSRSESNACREVQNVRPIDHLDAGVPCDGRSPFLSDERSILNGPSDLAERYLKIESQYGQTFRHKRSLKQILEG